METLVALISGGKRVYAAMEGALFDDLPTQLAAAGIAHRSLYRGGDRSLMVGGPWLADPYHFHPTEDDLYEPLGEDSIKLKDDIVPRPADPARQIEAIMAVATDCRAVVFWVGDDMLTEEALYDHLRTINQILVPGEDDETSGPERVTFRHADANVMTQVMPVLSAEQFVRLLGPASSIVFTPYEEWGGGLKRADRPDFATPPAGPLFFDIGTTEAISERRMEGSRRKVMAYLREVDPHADELSDAELYKQILVYEVSGNKLGLQSERAHMKWAYLMSITDGKADSDGVAKDYFQKSPKHPDNAIDDVLKALDEAVGDDWDRIWQGKPR